MNFGKIFGWSLLIVGVVIIGWSLYSSYNIFTGKAKAPEIFKISKELPPTSKNKISLYPQKELEKLISKQLKDILPSETLPKLLNLISWSILAGILIFGGSQIASLGIKLIKK